MNWTDPTQDMEQWRALVNTVINLSGFHKMLVSSRTFAWLAASQEVLNSTELIGYFPLLQLSNNWSERRSGWGISRRSTQFVLCVYSWLEKCCCLLHVLPYIPPAFLLPTFFYLIFFSDDGNLCVPLKRLSVSTGLYAVTSFICLHVMMFPVPHIK
jgi:hypothetical protein